MLATVGACASGAPAPPSDGGPVVELVERHLVRYPEGEVQDLYKLLHQACMGPAHAAPSEERARQFLLEEIQGLRAPSSEEEVLEVLDPAAGLVRVHLRPWWSREPAASRDEAVAELAQAFVATAARFPPSEPALESALAVAAGVVRRRPSAAFTADELVQYSARLREQGYPAVHHSEAYQRLYQPAYRVVLRSLWRSPWATAPGAP